VDELGGLVWAVTRAHRLGDADAADVAQTTWLRLVEHLDRLDDPARVGAWLATTARRECLRVLRRCAQLVPHCDDLPEPADDAAAHDSALLAQERDAALWAAFAGLGDRDRSLLRMLMADPAPSYEEIGAALGMPIGSIGPTRARALQRLRGAVECLGLTDRQEGPTAIPEAQVGIRPGSPRSI
ncbi:MAG TPA: sigma-70 family RNA polymerase sigma factor, partial [Solirubrobacteraceae bacterium]|nr:sigma-70 family RNA polymerase sigma factor [Solirubrobacteraceae bacterium]